MRWLIDFLFPRQLHRLSYFLRLVAANVFSAFLYRSSTTIDPRLWWIAVIGVSLYGLFFILLPRLRDAGMSAWWLIAALIPFVAILLGIILLFRAPEYHYTSKDAEHSET